MGTVLFITLVFALAFKVQAHCQYKPEITLNQISDGVSEQVQCLVQSACVRDTFYRDTLFKDLMAQYNSHRYAVIGVIDSIVSGHVPFYSPFDSLDIWDSLRTERVWITITDHLKGNYPHNSLVLEDSWSSYNELPPIASYDSIINNSFIAFFDSADSMHHMGLGPLDGCFFEPTGFYIYGNCIVKLGTRGLIGRGARFPGVAVKMNTFLQAIGRDSASVAGRIPGFNPWVPSMKWQINNQLSFLQVTPSAFRISIYNCSGRLVARESIDTPNQLEMNIPYLPPGLYWAQLKGQSWEHIKKLIVKQTGIYLDPNPLPNTAAGDDCPYFFDN